MSPPRIRAAVPADYPGVARMMDARAPGRGESWLRRLLWQARNPWQANIPLGLVLDAGGELAGYHFGIVQPLWLDGGTVPASFALDLFVASEWRGQHHGLELIRSVFGLAGDGPAFTTTANRTSEALWARLGAHPLPRGGSSLVRFRPSVRLLVAGVERAGLRSPWTPASGGSRTVAPEPSDLGSGWTAEALAAPYAAAAALWSEVRPSFPLATDRSEGFLSWRYAPDSPGGVLIGVRRSGGPLRAWYACQLVGRGERTQVRLFSVLDVIGRPDDGEALAALGRDVRGRARASGADVLEARGMRREFRAALRGDAGMRERELPSNPFWARLRSSVPPAEGWHLVAGDGDGGFA